MSHKLVLLVATASLLVCGSSATFMGKLLVGSNFENSYSDINNLLIKRLPDSESIADNLRAVRELKVEREDPMNCLFKLPIRDALQQILSMEDAIKGSKSCTKESIAILKANDLATKGRASTKPSRRIDRIVSHFIKEHARRCAPKYQTMFAQGYSTLSEESKLQMFKFPDAVLTCKIANTQRSRTTPLVRTDIQIDTLLKSPCYANAAISTIKLLAKDDPIWLQLKPVLEAGKLTDKEQVKQMRQLFKSYIVSSCQKWQDANGDMYSCFKYDKATSPEVGTFSMDFLLGYNYHKICKLIVKDEQEAFFHSIIKKLSQ